MPILKKYRFEKLTNGNVLLYNIQTNSLVAVFSGPQMLVKDTFNSNTFFITNTSIKNKK